MNKDNIHEQIQRLKLGLEDDEVDDLQPYKGQGDSGRSSLSNESRTSSRGSKDRVSPASDFTSSADSVQSDPQASHTDSPQKVQSSPSTDRTALRTLSSVNENAPGVSVAEINTRHIHVKQSPKKVRTRVLESRTGARSLATESSRGQQPPYDFSYPDFRVVYVPGEVQTTESFEQLTERFQVEIREDRAAEKKEKNRLFTEATGETSSIELSQSPDKSSGDTSFASPSKDLDDHDEGQQQREDMLLDTPVRSRFNRCAARFLSPRHGEILLCPDCQAAAADGTLSFQKFLEREEYTSTSPSETKHSFLDRNDNGVLSSMCVFDEDFSSAHEEMTDSDVNVKQMEEMYQRPSYLQSTNPSPSTTSQTLRYDPDPEIALTLPQVEQEPLLSSEPQTSPLPVISTTSPKTSVTPPKTATRFAGAEAEITDKRRHQSAYPSPETAEYSKSAGLARSLNRLELADQSELAKQVVRKLFQNPQCIPAASSDEAVPCGELVFDEDITHGSVERQPDFRARELSDRPVMGNTGTRPRQSSAPGMRPSLKSSSTSGTALSPKSSSVPATPSAATVPRVSSKSLSSLTLPKDDSSLLGMKIVPHHSYPLQDTESLSGDLHKPKPASSMHAQRSPGSLSQSCSPGKGLPQSSSPPPCNPGPIPIYYYRCSACRVPIPRSQSLPKDEALERLCCVLRDHEAPIEHVTELVKDLSICQLDTPSHVFHMTPLMLAANAQRWDIVQLLLTNGAHPDVAMDSHVMFTALLFACWHAPCCDVLPAVRMLRWWGADLNVQDVHGCTPLCYSTANDNRDLTDYLLLHGATRPTGHDHTHCRLQR